MCAAPGCRQCRQCRQGRRRAPREQEAKPSARCVERGTTAKLVEGGGGSKQAVHANATLCMENLETGTPQWNGDALSKQQHAHVDEKDQTDSPGREPSTTSQTNPPHRLRWPVLFEPTRRHWRGPVGLPQRRPWVPWVAWVTWVTCVALRPREVAVGSFPRTNTDSLGSAKRPAHLRVPNSLESPTSQTRLCRYFGRKGRPGGHRWSKR